MKTKMILCLLALFAISQVQAQNEKTEAAKNNFSKAIKIQPLPAIFEGEFVLSYEQQISKRGSLEFELAYDNQKNNNPIDPRRVHGFNARAGYRYYITKKESRLQGLYARAGLEGNLLYLKDVNTVTSLGANAHIGHQWVLNSLVKGLTFDVNAGGQFYRILAPEAGRALGTQFDIDLNLRIGYSF